jgi:hypothetical protein
VIEAWKEIPGYNGIYEVSDQGNVRSYQSRGVGKPNLTRQPKNLIPKLNSNGYLRVNITLDGKAKFKSVHRLVMLAFVGDSPLEVNHKNTIRTDNRLENLEYLTVAENRRYAVDVLGKKRTSTAQRGEKSGGAKLTENQVIEIRKAYQEGAITSDLANKYSLSRSACIRIINGKTWKHLPGAARMENPRNKNYYKRLEDE